jgi:hypothetical protein
VNRDVEQTITVEGVRAQNDAAFGHMQKIKLPDDTTLNLFTAPGRRK